MKQHILLLSLFVLFWSTSGNAITITNKLATGSDTNSATYTTASVAFSNNKLYLLAVGGRLTGVPASPTISGGGITWVEINTSTFDTIASPDRRVTVYRGYVRSGAISEALTITWASSMSSCEWVLDELEGVDISGTNGSGAIAQSAVNSANSGATSITATLGSFGDSQSLTWAAFGLSTQGASGIMTAGSGFTLGGAYQSSGEAHSISSEYRLTNGGDTTVDGTFSSAAVGVVAIEVRAWGTAPEASPITISNKLAVADNTNGQVYTTASVAFSNNKLYLLAVSGRHTGGIPAAPTVSGGGITWTTVNDVAYGTNASPQRRVVVYRGLVTSGASTGTLTISWAGGSNLSSCDWVLDEFDGINLTGTNGSGAVIQSATNYVDSNTTVTATLSAFESSTTGEHGPLSVKASKAPLSLPVAALQLVVAPRVRQKLTL